MKRFFQALLNALAQLLLVVIVVFGFFWLVDTMPYVVLAIFGALVVGGLVYDNYVKLGEDVEDDDDDDISPPKAPVCGGWEGIYG